MAGRRARARSGRRAGRAAGRLATCSSRWSWRRSAAPTSTRVLGQQQAQPRSCSVTSRSAGRRARPGWREDDRRPPRGARGAHRLVGGGAVRPVRPLPPRAAAEVLDLQKYGHERMRRGWELSGRLRDPHPHPRRDADGARARRRPRRGARSGVLLDRDRRRRSGGRVGDRPARRCARPHRRGRDAGPHRDGDGDGCGCARRRAATPVPRTTGVGAVAVRCGGGRRPGAPTRRGARQAQGRARPPRPIALELSGDPAAVRSLLGAWMWAECSCSSARSRPARSSASSPSSWCGNLLTIRGVHNYAPRHLEQAVRFLADAWQRYPFAEQVGETFPLAEVDRGARHHARTRASLCGRSLGWCSTASSR